MCNEVSSYLATQCLAFCQTLASQGQASKNSTNVDAHEKEKPTVPTHAEDVLTLKLDLEYWKWPRNKALPPKVHHPHEGLGTSNNLYTDALGSGKVSCNLKNGVHDV